MRVNLALLGLLALFSTSCGLLRPAPLAANADPVVVHAERTAEYALATFDTFLLWEQQDRTLLNKSEVKAVADSIRLHGKQWINDLRTTTQAYKAVRSQPNADKLDLALTVVNRGLEMARRYLVTNSAVAPTG